LTTQAVIRTATSILIIAGSKNRLTVIRLNQPPQKESPAKHERDSGQESQSLFFAGFISRLRFPARFSPSSRYRHRDRQDGAS
jgi:hypothetical protein